jgi:hypothetical protein
MANCEKSVFNAASLTPTLPGPDDVVFFTLPDETTVLRKWSTITTGIVPPDKEIVVAASSGTINNGDNAKIFSDLVGRRIRFFRNLLKQSTINQGASYFSFNSATGEVSWVPAAVSGELFQIECY